MTSNNALEMASPEAARVSVKDKENRGELDRISICPAENGFSCEAAFKPKSKPSERNRSPYPDPEHLVFESSGSLLKYVAKLLVEHEEWEKEEE